MRMKFIPLKDFYYLNKCKMNYDTEVDNMKEKTRYDNNNNDNNTNFYSGLTHQRFCYYQCVS